MNDTYNIDDLLNNYRRSFQEERGIAKVESKEGIDDDMMGGRAPYDDMDDDDMDDRDEWSPLAQRESPITTLDPRFTGNEEEDLAAYKEYLSNDPVIKEHGPQMEAMLYELIDQMNDPEMPMDEATAKQTFSQMMIEKFGQYFQ